MRFSPECLTGILFNKLGVRKDRKLILAYSGGCDSQVLLHCLSVLKRQDQTLSVLAAHFDHGLEQNSCEWVDRCRLWAKQLGVKFVSGSAGNALESSSNVEAAGRELRYRWLASLGASGDTVLTAHHEDDQAETFLCRVFRGGDFAQLAGIYPARPILHGSKVQLARPLLNFSKEQIRQYAVDHRLDWIEDPSNLRSDADRNFLRNRLLPVLYSRGRITRQMLVQAAAHCRQVDLDREKHIERIVSTLIQPKARSVLCMAAPIDLSTIDIDDQGFFVQIIRCWLHMCGRSSPTDKQLATFFRQIKNGTTGLAEISLKGERVRYFDEKIYLTRAVEVEIPKSGSVRWMEGRRKLQEIGLDLKWNVTGKEMGQRLMPLEANLEFAWHCGRKKVKLLGNSQSRMIRKLQQSRKIPPWERYIIPCLLWNGRIVWVHGVGITADYEPKPDDSALDMMPVMVPIPPDRHIAMPASP